LLQRYYLNHIPKSILIENDMWAHMSSSSLTVAVEKLGIAGEGEGLHHAVGKEPPHAAGEASRTARRLAAPSRKGDHARER
jgi:hypothetical protein